MMKVAEALQLAEELLYENHPEPWLWEVTTNRRKTTFGLTRFKTWRPGDGGTIELSVHAIERNERTKIVDTILHEIAHALCSPSEGHGAKWRATARKIGAKPSRCGKGDLPKGRYAAICEEHGVIDDAHRMGKAMREGRHVCRQCKRKVTWVDTKVRTQRLLVLAMEGSWE